MICTIFFVTTKNVISLRSCRFPMKNYFRWRNVVLRKLCISRSAHWLYLFPLIPVLDFTGFCDDRHQQRLHGCLMPSLRAEKFKRVCAIGLASVPFFVPHFLLAWESWQQNAVQRNQNVEAGCESQCETKSLLWNSVQLSYRVLVTWISFGKKKFVWKFVLDWSINFPWFDVDKIASGLFIPQLRF